MDSKAKVYEIIAKYAIGWDKPVASGRIRIYTEALHSHGPAKIEKAMMHLLKTLRFFPSLAEIEEAVNPKPTESESIELAGKIMHAIVNFSAYDTKAVRESVGEMGMLIIERVGGLDALTKITYSEMGTTRAQVERMCKALMRTNHNRENAQILEFKPGLSRIGG